MIIHFANTTQDQIGHKRNPGSLEIEPSLFKCVYAGMRYEDQVKKYFSQYGYDCGVIRPYLCQKRFSENNSAATLAYKSNRETIADNNRTAARVANRRTINYVDNNSTISSITHVDQNSTNTHVNNNRRTTIVDKSKTKTIVDISKTTTRVDNNRTETTASTTRNNSIENKMAIGWAIGLASLIVCFAILFVVIKVSKNLRRQKVIFNRKDNYRGRHNDSVGTQRNVNGVHNFDQLPNTSHATHLQEDMELTEVKMVHSDTPVLN